MSHVTSNECENTVCFRSAVADVEGSASLYINDSNSGDHRTYQVGTRLAVKVDQVALDTFGPTAEACPSVIKIDIQGTEPRAIRGMVETIARAEELALFTEFWPA